MKLQDLRTCLDILLDHAAKFHGFSSIDLNGLDTYWSIPAWLDVGEQPVPVIGSFVDDVEELNKLLANPDRASALDLERLANVLRLLSDQLVAE